MGLRMQKRVALAVELNSREQREQGFCDRLERFEIHMAASDAGIVQMLLAAADLATQIAFVGQGDVGDDRRRYGLAAALEKPPALGMILPPQPRQGDAGALPRLGRQGKIIRIVATVEVRVRAVAGRKQQLSVPVAVPPGARETNGGMRLMRKRQPHAILIEA